jgi:hypothetical protein
MLRMRLRLVAARGRGTTGASFAGEPDQARW